MTHIAWSFFCALFYYAKHVGVEYYVTGIKSFKTKFVNSMNIHSKIGVFELSFRIVGMERK